MGFSPEVAAIRFGEGLSPDLPAPVSRGALLDQLTGPDEAAKTWPIPSVTQLLPQMAHIRALNSAARKGRNGPDAEELRDQYKDAQRGYARTREADAISLIVRASAGPTPFRERLMRFWADHFTVTGRSILTRPAVPAYMEEVIRPHIAGRFADMLRAATFSPHMLDYLDQNASVGPNSRAARGRRGLNENLARELLELHTLGVGSAYSQTDVRQLAELLTGLHVELYEGFTFRPAKAEPGAEKVLDRVYGGGLASLDHIEEALEDLAMHPDTARHLARKLAVHFTSDQPDMQLVAKLEAAYLASGGELMQVYEVLLTHRESWESFGKKVKQPIDFVTSSLRALAVPPKSLLNLNRTRRRAYLAAPMASMGQSWLNAPGPDGWDEEATAWVTPQGLAARIQWSLSMPSAIFRSLPDPRTFVQTALGDRAGADLRFAASAAETRRDGVGLILASPDFQRR